MPTITLDGSAIPDKNAVIVGNRTKWATVLRRSADTVDGRLPVGIVIQERNGQVQDVKIIWYYTLLSGEHTTHTTAWLATTSSIVTHFLGFPSLPSPSSLSTIELHDWDLLRDHLVREGLMGRGIAQMVAGMDDQALTSNMRFGFELETQSTEGASEQGENESVLDEDAYNQAVEEAAERILSQPLEWRYYIPALGTVDFNGMAVEAHDSENWKTIIRFCNPSTVFDLVGRGILTQHQARVADRNIRSDAKADVYRADFLVEKSFQWFASKYASAFSDMDLVIGSDGSVDGFEFRTEGGQTASRFMEQARHIFNLEHDIDTRCSFHLHVSINRDGLQIPFRFDRTVKAAATEYLLSRMADVPRSVRTRWADDSASEYFIPTLNNEKYSFVNPHSFGTLEYRCFGNVQNADDARRCLELATLATLHVVKVLRGDAVLLLDTKYEGDEEDWERDMTAAMLANVAVILPSLHVVAPLTAEGITAPTTEPLMPPVEGVG